MAWLITVELEADTVSFVFVALLCVLRKSENVMLSQYQCIYVCIYVSCMLVSICIHRQYAMLDYLNTTGDGWGGCNQCDAGWYSGTMRHVLVRIFLSE